MFDSADKWLAIRQTRNQMIHDYMESPEVLSSAIQETHEFQPAMFQFANNLFNDVKSRGVL